MSTPKPHADDTKVTHDESLGQRILHKDKIVKILREMYDLLIFKSPLDPQCPKSFVPYGAFFSDILKKTFTSLKKKNLLKNEIDSLLFNAASVIVSGTNACQTYTDLFISPCVQDICIHAGDVERIPF